MPLFVGHLLMWPLKSGRLHIVDESRYKRLKCSTDVTYTIQRSELPLSLI